MPIVGWHGSGAGDVAFGCAKFAAEHSSRYRSGEFVAGWLVFVVVLIGSAEFAERIDHEVEALALDELHRVVVQAIVLADVEHGHDMRVVQPGGCSCF